MDIEDVIYFEQLYRRLNRWQRRGIHALISNKIGGYTTKEISCIPKAFGLSQYCNTAARVSEAIQKGKQTMETEHEIEKYWGRV